MIRRWMRGRTRRELDATRWALALETDRRVGAERDADQARQVQLFEVTRRAEAEAGAKRAEDRNRRLSELLELARTAQNDGEYEALEGRHERLLRAVVRYRAALAGQARRIGVLERQVDAARIGAGAEWQSRRADKPTPAAH